jgi:V/A-type H+-transporting ATPase subunit D
MAIKIQYNKTYLQLLQKQLKVRENALPTLQAKESALRLEVKKARDEVREVEARLAQSRLAAQRAGRLWSEFPAGVVSVDGVDIDYKKVAGVKTPIFRGVRFSTADVSLFLNASWVFEGIEIVKASAALGRELTIARSKVAALEYARKKTTQKVNLYEKVQIPEYREALLKIKRFLEDDENLAKSSQKILKARIAAAEAAS